MFLKFALVSLTAAITALANHSHTIPSPVLKSDGFDPDKVRASDLWGCGTAQIFSAVSPAMHQEFDLASTLQWMKRFGLNYYGCCEPLDKKIEILRNIPNLRKKQSMSFP